MQKIDKEPTKKLTFMDKVFQFIRDIIILSISGGLIYFFDVYNVMMYSKRVYREVMYFALFLHFCAFMGGMYMTWIISRTDPNFENCDGTIKTTTALFVAGSVVWMISVWPVFHFWTFVLSIAFLFFTIVSLSMISIQTAKKKRM